MRESLREYLRTIATVNARLQQSPDSHLNPQKSAMKTLAKSIGAIVPILMLVNTFGAIVGGIWAAIYRDWWSLVLTALAMVFSHWIIGLLLFPAVALAAIAASAINRGHILWGRIAISISTLYIDLLMFFWVITITGAFMTHTRSAPVLPMLLLAYGSSTSGWAYLASKDQQSDGNELALISVVLLQVGYIIGAILFLLNPKSTLFFSLPILVAMVVNWISQQFNAIRVSDVSATHSI